MAKQFADLRAPSFHFAKTAVEHLDLLAVFGKIEARLRQRFLLLVAVGPQRGDLGFDRRDGLLLGGNFGLGRSQAGLGAHQALFRLGPGLFQTGEFPFHAGKTAGHLFSGPFGIPRLGLHGGHLLGRR